MQQSASLHLGQVAFAAVQMASLGVQSQGVGWFAAASSLVLAFVLAHILCCIHDDDHVIRRILPALAVLALTPMGGQVPHSILAAVLLVSAPIPPLRFVLYVALAMAHAWLAPRFAAVAVWLAMALEAYLVDLGGLSVRMLVATAPRTMAELPALSIWEGFTTHSRKEIREHKFSYRVWMALVDADADVAKVAGSLPRWLFDARPLGRVRARSLFAYAPHQHYGQNMLPDADASTKLGARVRAIIAARTGTPATSVARVYMLTTLEGFGLCFNPISIFYCYSATGELVWVVSEVTNTPWTERTVYVSRPRGSEQHPKQMHVSPFITLKHSYNFSCSDPLDAPVQPLTATIRVEPASFYAFLSLQPVATRDTGTALLRLALCALPPAWKTLVRIHFQAAWLFFLRRVPFIPHPKYSGATPAAVPLSCPR